MAAPFVPWERNSTTDWAYDAGARPSDYSRRARRSIGRDVLARIWSRTWCEGPSAERDAVLALVERLRAELGLPAHAVRAVRS